MKILFLVLGFLFSFSSQAFIGGIEPTEMSADMICEDPAPNGFMVIGIKWPTETEKAKMWLSSKNQPQQGFPMEVIEFRVFRCLGCFTFRARFADSLIKGTANKYDLEVFNHDIGSAGTDEVFKMKCEEKN